MRPNIPAQREYQGKKGRQFRIREGLAVAPPDREIEALVAVKLGLTEEDVAAVDSGWGGRQDDVDQAVAPIVAGHAMKVIEDPVNLGTISIPPSEVHAEAMLDEHSLWRRAVMAEFESATRSRYKRILPKRVKDLLPHRDLQERFMAAIHSVRSIAHHRRGDERIYGVKYTIHDFFDDVKIHVNAGRRTEERAGGGEDWSDEFSEGEVAEGSGEGWGDMLIRHPDLHIPRRTAREVRAVDIGDSLRRPHRLCIDQQVFGRRRASERGTVLIDASGSMSVEPGEIGELCQVMPAGKVALYNGGDGKGVLAVVAQGGRMVPGEPLDYGYPEHGNEVDRPAYEWLLTQPQPWYYVTDWGFGGVGTDHQTVRSLQADVQNNTQVTVYGTVRKATEAHRERRTR